MSEKTLPNHAEDSESRNQQSLSSRSSLIHADLLSRSFGSQTALENVSLSIGPGTICSVLGPNGAGKTTLLRLLYGLISPTSGACGIVGDSSLPRSKRSLQSTGCLIDGVEPPGHISIRELTLLSQSVSAGFDRKLAKKLLGSMKLTPRMLWRTLSKGQKRWAALVMLLSRQCDVLLLDEPADGLDPHARSELYDLLRREANDRGIAILVTTHIIHDIEKITDEVCVLHQGKILFEEPLEDLRDQLLSIVLDDPKVIPSEVQVLHQNRESEIGSPVSVWVRDIVGHLNGSVLSGEIHRSRVSLAELYRVIIDKANFSSRQGKRNG